MAKLRYKVIEKLIQEHTARVIPSVVKAFAPKFAPSFFFSFCRDSVLSNCWSWDPPEIKASLGRFYPLPVGYWLENKDHFFLFFWNGIWGNSLALLLVISSYIPYDLISRIIYYCVDKACIIKFNPFAYIISFTWICLSSSSISLFFLKAQLRGFHREEASSYFHIACELSAVSSDGGVCHWPAWIAVISSVIWTFWDKRSVLVIVLPLMPSMVLDISHSSFSHSLSIYSVPLWSQELFNVLWKSEWIKKDKNPCFHGP